MGWWLPWLTLAWLSGLVWFIRACLRAPLDTEIWGPNGSNRD